MDNAATWTMKKRTCTWCRATFIGPSVHMAEHKAECTMRPKLIAERIAANVTKKEG